MITRELQISKVYAFIDKLRNHKEYDYSDTISNLLVQVGSIGDIDDELVSCDDLIEDDMCLFVIRDGNELCIYIGMSMKTNTLLDHHIVVVKTRTIFKL